MSPELDGFDRRDLGIEEGKICATGLYLLYEPGFLTNQGRFFAESTREQTPDGLWLLDKYVAIAHRLTDNQLMVVFLPRTKKSQLGEDSKKSKPYTETLKELKSILGIRLITITAEYINPDNLETAVAQMHKLARRNRIDIDRGVPTFAFGETLGFIEEFFCNFNKAAGFECPTQIDPYCSDYKTRGELNSPQNLFAHQQSMLEEYNRITYYKIEQAYF